jgi:disulfide bond formation protein DsbB
MTGLSFRGLFALGFLACAGAMGFALYLQYGQGDEPCPMCIFQRIAMMAGGFLFLLGALHGPRGGGRWAYVCLVTLAFAAGAGIAGRQVWLQHLPPDQAPGCGPTLSYLLHILPVSQVIETVLKGDGDCAKINAQWLGIALPEWTLFAFIGLILYTLASPRLARR